MTASEQALQRLMLQQEVDQLNAAYAAALDEKRFEEWPEFFVEDGRYKLQARENFDRGLPLALMALESRGMMKDRVYGVTQTIYHGPYYMRHIVSPARILSHEVSQEGTPSRPRPITRCSAPGRAA